MGTPNDLHPRSKEDVMNDMATDPQYVMTESDAHVIGRDLEIAEAIFNTDFKKVKKYLRYAILRDFFMGKERPGINLMDNIFNRYATRIARVGYPLANGKLNSFDAELFLTKSNELILVHSEMKPAVKVFGSLKYLCEYIDSNVSASRKPDDDSYWSRVFVRDAMGVYDHAASAMAAAFLHVMEDTISDRLKWLETLESASATAKRRIAQIDY